MPTISRNFLTVATLMCFSVFGALNAAESLRRVSAVNAEERSAAPGNGSVDRFADARNAARLALAKGEFHAAQERFAEALRLNPSDSETQCELAQAQVKLGHSLAGLPSGRAEAVAWYRKAAFLLGLSAEKGYAPAQTDLASLYFSGQGVTQDFGKAQELCRKAAVKGYAPAQFNLGAIYYKGQGVERNVREAIRWIRQAANQGYPEAVTLLRDNGLEI